MSDLQNEKETIVEGKKNRLKDVDAALRDQIPKKLLKKLREKKIGTKVNQLWHEGNADRARWLERQQAFLSDWDEFVTPNSEGPFEQSSNLHIPMSFTVVKTYHARMLQALMATEPYAKPRRPDAAERATTVSQLMNYAVRDWSNNYQGIEKELDTWVWDWCATGVGILKWRWDVQYSRFIDVEKTVEIGAPEVTIGPDGEEQLIPTFVEGEEEVTKTEKTFDGPCLERIAPEDVLIVGGEGDVLAADAVLHRQYLTASDLNTLAYRKIFEEEEVNDVILGGPDYRYNDHASNIKQQRRSNSGLTNENNHTELDRYEILECYLKLDVDGNGVNSDVVAWVHPHSGRILRATYLRRINKAGRRPFIKIDFHKRPGQQYGMGLVEVLYPLSQEIDLMRNSRIDFGMLSTMPFFFYRASSSLDPETIQFEPGMGIPVDDPARDIVFPNLGNRTTFGYQEEQAINVLVEKLTGVSDLTLGVVSSSQGASRTATGARTLVNEANANLDVHLRRLMAGWRQTLEYLLHLLQQRVPEDLAFRVTGDDGNDYWNYIKKQEDIKGDYDFIVDPSSADSNPAVREQRAAEVLQFVSNPLYLQLGMVSPGNVFEAAKSWLQAKNIREVSRYLTKPAEVTFMMTPEEEANRVLTGQEVALHPQMDHEGFIKYVDEIIGDDNLLGQFDQQQTLALVAQQRKHQQMLQALQQAQAQAQNLQQQQINAAQAQFQAPMATPTQAPQGGNQEQ